MEYVKIDSSNNILKILDSKEDENCLEIGKDIFWKVDVKRNGQIISISPNDMVETEEVVKFYDNVSELKLSVDNGVKTIRFKTYDEMKKEKYKTLILKVLNDQNIKSIVSATLTQLLQTNMEGINQSNAIFNNQECLDWQNWYNTLAKDDMDLSGFSLEQINESILNMPPIPISFVSRFL
jgi:hypothetical protein